MFAQEIIATIGSDEVSILMGYDENDPLAIYFTFPHGDTLVDCVFARDLLVEAIGEGTAGLGDVQFVISDGIVSMKITDSTDGMEYTAKFPFEEIHIFLEQTASMVPFGDEHKYYDIDKEWLEFSRDS